MKITYERIIESVNELKSLSKENEFEVAGLVIHSIANYVSNREKSLDMIQVLMDENIQPLSNVLRSQIDDRMKPS